MDKILAVDVDETAVDAIIRKYSLATGWKDVYNILTETNKEK